MDFLPAPQNIKHIEGSFTIDYRKVIVLSNTPPAVLLYAQMLKEAIEQETGLALSILRGEGRPGDICLSLNDALPAYTYQIKIGEHGILLSGGSKEAICNGVQTLCQWVQRHGACLPALEIEDYPDIKSRGYYLDVSRGRIPTLATLKQYADLLCRYKINEWQLYVEHTYLFRDFSEVWRDDTPLEAEEIMELDAYCAARCIELVPSLSTFGHMFKILSTKTYDELRELKDGEKYPFTFANVMDHHTLNVSSEKALPFILQMMDEYMQLFSSRKFNICADETFDLGKGRSAKLTQEVGERTLYMNHVKALCEHLVARGHTPMFWGDIVVRFKEAYNILPKETICLNWGYLPNQREYEIQTLAEVGATQYACPGVCAWNRWIPLVRASYDNNRVMCAHGRKYNVIGHLNTDWGDYGHINHPWFSIPGILYGAAFSWNAEAVDFEEINRAISRLEYGDASESFMEGFTALSDHEVFDWSHAVRWMETRDEKRRREIFDEVKVDTAPDANRALDEALKALRTAARSMPQKKRALMQALNVIADGVRIFNEIAVYIGYSHYGLASGNKPGSALAVELETWFRAYTMLYRSVSKEGSLVRITKMITDYADMLR